MMNTKNMKSIKKFILRFTATAVTAGLLATTALAYSGAASVKVNTSLNVRQYGSTSAPIIGRLYNGLELTVQSTANGWAKISYYGGTGYVSTQYLSYGDVYASSNSKIQTVVDAAKRVIGVKYVYGGASVSGFDCSGLLVYSFKKAGVTLPHSSSQQAAKGTYVARANLRPGDAVFFDTDGGKNNITHVGIYIGGGNFIHAQTGSVRRITITSLNNSYWSSVYMTARRYIG